MSARKASLIILWPALLLILSFNFAQASYSVGDTVNNFTLNDVHGNPISLYNYQGEIILLNFFATW